ncbi:hypothetical protein, partial [Salmonella sp. ZJHZ19_0056]|uniref:hypothetical protein n=1 Tax=Salmonella sp. ZJHZ19_0056 TaxID=3159584 RepID=UPI00397D6C4A
NHKRINRLWIWTKGLTVAHSILSMVMGFKRSNEMRVTEMRRAQSRYGFNSAKFEKLRADEYN